MDLFFGPGCLFDLRIEVIMPPNSSDNVIAALVAGCPSAPTTAT